MKNQWRVIIGLILVLLVVVFAVLNNQIVPVNFGFAKITGPLILIILGSAILGALIGLLASTTTIWNQKKTVRALQKELEQAKTDAAKATQEEKATIQKNYEQQLTDWQAKYEQLKQATDDNDHRNQTKTGIDRYTKPRDHQKE